MMNILHINTWVNVGGAARSAYRLHQGLKQAGYVSRILAGSRDTIEPDTFGITETVSGRYSSFDRWLDNVGRRVEKRLGVPYTRYRSTRHILETDLFQQAQVVNLHNLHGRYFNYHLLPAFCERKPIVWTLHDMWALTGHCAYAYDCQRWKTGCFDCPLLQGNGRQLVEPPPTRRDYTGCVWRTKRQLYQRTDLHVVAPSRWLRDLAKESILGGAATIQCIPYGLDLSVFRPVDQSLARRALDIPLDAKVVLFVSESIAKKRKGLRYLLDALRYVQDAESVVLLTIGHGGASGVQLARFRRRDLGVLSDERLISLAYNAADLFVFPTLADNLPVVLLEAMACGTPMVAFDVGGVPEIVHHMETGYLAHYKDTEDLARGIQTLLGGDDLRNQMRQRCRQVAEREYALALQARRYIELYEVAVGRHYGGVANDGESNPGMM